MAFLISCCQRTDHRTRTNKYANKLVVAITDQLRVDRQEHLQQRLPLLWRSAVQCWQWHALSSQWPLESPAAQTESKAEDWEGECRYCQVVPRPTTFRNPAAEGLTTLQLVCLQGPKCWPSTGEQGHTAANASKNKRIDHKVIYCGTW